jgi:regulator of protease activity HflC (stomatin/prohibitin superfamily)
MVDESLARQLGRASASGGLVPGWAKTAFYAALLALVFFVAFGVNFLSVLGVVVLFGAVAALYSAVVIVQPYERHAYSLLGNYRGLLEPGLNLVAPFVSRTYPFDLRTETVDGPRQEAITRDNSPVTADAVIYIRVVDAERAFLEVDDYGNAVSNLAQTTLRAALGDMDLDDILSRREEINDRIRVELDEPTDEWGVRVESVEVREVKPSRDVQAAMEQQTSAERRRRAMILEAQGERRSAIEQAEGDRSANVIRAQGEKQAQILEAQGDAISTVLRAKAAESMGERAIVDKGMETLAEIGGSKSTTYLIPQELTSLLGRYGKSLSGSDVQQQSGLESGDFDAETRDLIGLDDIEEIAAGVGAREVSGEAVKNGDSGNGAPADVDVDLNIDREGNGRSDDD